MPRQGPGIGVYLLLCAVAALWADLGTLHRLQHGDSLLPVLVSLQRWTPFFWEQDRYGMLIPWLAQPLTQPFWNLLFQGFLNVTCGLAAFFLMARYMLRGPDYPLVGALGATAFLTLAPAPYRFDYLMDANYGVWMTLGFGGLIVAEPGENGLSWGRRLVALALIVLAHWVYGAAALYLGALVAFRVLFDPESWRVASRDLRRLRSNPKEFGVIASRAARSGPGQALLLLAVGLWIGMRLTNLTPHHQTSYLMLPPGEWPLAWSRLVERTWRALAPGGWPLALSSSALVVVIACCTRGRDCRSSLPWREASALLASAILVAMFLGMHRWLKLNAYVPRYLIPSALLAQSALSTLIVVPIGRGIAPDSPWRRALPALVAVVLLLSVATAYGLPSPRRVRADLERFGALTPDVLAAGCTHLAGDYWTVWPAVFHANLTLRERGESRTIWGVTFRGQPASMHWWHGPQERRCACIPVNDPYGENWLLAFGFGRFREVARRGKVRVLRRLADPAAADPR